VVRRRVAPLRVIVPMKGLAQAKTLLLDGVPTLQRQGVTLMMLDRVIRAVVLALGPTACQVVGGDDPVRGVVDDAGVMWRADPGMGLNGSLWTAMREAYEDGCMAAMFMPGDLPLLDAADVASLAHASDDYARPVGVMASQDGGTNALLVPATMAFEPLLGEDSFEKHTKAFLSAGAELCALDLPNVAFDMDSFADFAWVRDNVRDFNQSLDSWQARLYKEKD